MAPRPIQVFFYGLFMDPDLLRAQGVRPSSMRQAHLPHFELRIGPRASLVPNPDATVHGFLTTLFHHELDRLYAAPGLNGYRAEPVLIHPLDGPPTPALCFNLPEPPSLAERNAEYAAKLRALATQLGLPPGYLRTIG